MRRHRSAINSGRPVAAFVLARLLVLAISDVPDDDPINIASKPTMPEPSICADALAIVRRYGIGLSSEALGDQVITGPTLTNVKDFRAVFIDEAGTA